jgi:hypothetical protein
MPLVIFANEARRESARENSRPFLHASPLPVNVFCADSPPDESSAQQPGGKAMKAEDGEKAGLGVRG